MSGRETYDPANNSASFVIAAAERIKLRVHRTNEDVVAIGHDLLLVHEMLGAERFQEWIAEEFEMSRSAAYRFMQVAKKVPNPTVGLSTTALYELAASPESVIEEVTARAEEGEVITASDVRELRQQVREAEQAETEKPPQHKVTNGRARPVEDHSSHDEEVMALLRAWDVARQSARNAFLSVSGLMRIPRDAADLSDDEHTEDAGGDRRAGEGVEDHVAVNASPERAGDRRGDSQGSEAAGANGEARAAERGGTHQGQGGVDEWPEIPPHLRRVA